MSSYAGYEEEDYIELCDVIDGGEAQQAKVLADWIITRYVPTSIVDVGCATSLYLTYYPDSVTKLGLDALPYLPGGRLIDEMQYIRCDLRVPLILPQRFDIALCVEVAEHLPRSAAATLVETLAAASDTIIFGAAIPGQGGVHHHNEQPFAWWEAAFENCGYHHDPSESSDLLRYLIAASESGVLIHPWFVGNLRVIRKVDHNLTSDHVRVNLP
jgi:hypothetical protein